jgi:hypothetical protein
MVSRETQMSEFSVVSELLIANKGGERDAFSSAKVLLTEIVT